MPATALTIVHKYIRSELFDVAARLARGGRDDLDELRARLDEVMELLHQHALHEEAQLEPPLRARDAGGADRLLRDHEQLHAGAADVHRRLAVLDADASDLPERLLQLYLDWNRFVAGYLLHIDEEERTLFAGMDELPPLHAFGRTVLEHDPAGGRVFLELLWRLVSPDERAAIERGIG